MRKSWDKYLSWRGFINKLSIHILYNIWFHKQIVFTFHNGNIVVFTQGSVYKKQVHREKNPQRVCEISVNVIIAEEVKEFNYT